MRGVPSDLPAWWNSLEWSEKDLMSSSSWTTSMVSKPCLCPASTILIARYLIVPLASVLFWDLRLPSHGLLTLTPSVVLGSLGQLIAERGRLPEDLTLHYHCQVLGALEHLVKKRVVHLDIKGRSRTETENDYFWIFSQ